MGHPLTLVHHIHHIHAAEGAVVEGLPARRGIEGGPIEIHPRRPSSARSTTSASKSRR